MQLCISNIVLCARLPRKVRAAASGKARKSINVYALHFLHLSHGHPAVPSQHNAVESRQWIDKAGGMRNLQGKQICFPLCLTGGGRSYPAADDEGTLKKPALRLESFHSSSSLMRRWQNASEGRRPCYVATLFSSPPTHKWCPPVPIPLPLHFRRYRTMEMSSIRVAIAWAGLAVMWRKWTIYELQRKKNMSQHWENNWMTNSISYLALLPFWRLIALKVFAEPQCPISYRHPQLGSRF